MDSNRVFLGGTLLLGLCLLFTAGFAIAATTRDEACLWIDRADTSPLVGCAVTGDLTKARTIVHSGGDVNVRSERGMTPLMLAALNGHTPFVTYLLENGADPNLQDLNGDSALTFAATKGHMDIARMLLERGAAVDARNIRGITPLMWAAAFGHSSMADLLIKHGADVNARIEPGWTCEIEDCKFKTALEAAQMNGHRDIVTLLKRAGAET